MFKRIRGGGIRSDSGFSIMPHGRAGLDYIEGNKLIHINSEMLGDSRIGYVVASNSIDRWQGDTQDVDEIERARILHNIREAFQFLGYEIEIISDFC